MTEDEHPDLSARLLQHVVATLVRRDGQSLSAHQLGVFLTCYLHEDSLTVRGLAQALGISRAMVNRALDRLGELGLTQRESDPADERSVFVRRTPAGSTLLAEITDIATTHRPSAAEML